MFVWYPEFNPKDPEDRAMLDWFIHWLQTASWLAASLVFLAENLVILGLVIVIGNWMVVFFQHRRVALPPLPLTCAEIALALLNVGLNTVVTLVGWQLWRRGVIHFRSDFGFGALADVFVLLMVMDFLMYTLHRVAHHPWLYPVMHQLHHRYERLRPLTLFALNPIENLGFGMLWLLVITVYPVSWVGMSVYLGFNVAFGTIGHLGVEPVPGGWAQKPVLQAIAGSSFHAQHHQDINYNFGFYTLIWDRLFGTIQPHYQLNYGQLPAVEVNKAGV